jgi:hypothetical protein
MSTSARWKIIRLIIIKVKSILLLYNKSIIINFKDFKINIPQFLGLIHDNKKWLNKIKLSLMISHISFMTNGWYFPTSLCHIMS